MERSTVRADSVRWNENSNRVSVRVYHRFVCAHSCMACRKHESRSNANAIRFVLHVNQFSMYLHRSVSASCNSCWWQMRTRERIIRRNRSRAGIFTRTKNAIRKIVLYLQFDLAPKAIALLSWRDVRCDWTRITRRIVQLEIVDFSSCALYSAHGMLSHNKTL